jgi:hypothetical protein
MQKRRNMKSTTKLISNKTENEENEETEILENNFMNTNKILLVLPEINDDDW